jgi:hypothetical protein
MSSIGINAGKIFDDFLRKKTKQELFNEMMDEYLKARGLK